MPSYAIFGWSMTVAGAVVSPIAAADQVAPPGDRPAQPAISAPQDVDPGHATAPADDIVIVGHHGAVAIDVQPLATFDAAAIAATGATSIGELLRTIRGVTRSADGQDAIFLLNGQRVSGPDEIGSLPPEAIEKVDVLPEPAALRFGYPPTRRVVNFITKRIFHQLALKMAASTATRGGVDTINTHVDLTRLHDDARLTVSFDAHHTDALLQSRRHVLPDPDVPFDAVGNVTGTLAGGEIDPALSALAGQRVTVAPVPATGLDLAGFAASANQPRLFDLSPLHALAPANDTVHGEAVIADRIGRTLAGSLTLTADHSHEFTLYGPASATLLVPAGNPYSPFSTNVLLQRFLVEAMPLGQRTDSTTLHLGGVLRGAVGGWQWDMTGTLDAQRKDGTVGTAIDLTAANAAIAAGVDPFLPLPPALVAHRLVDRTVQTSSAAAAKLVATNRPLRLPAGSVTVTATAEVEQTGAHATTSGADTYATESARNRVEGAIALDVPITSRRDGFMGGAGDLSASVSGAVRRVGGFGTLSDSTAGLTWTPVDGLQILAQFKQSAAAPTLMLLASPQTSVPQVSLFDFGTGRSTLVTLLAGGNPALAAEHRTVRSIGATLKPFARKELRISATYEATRIGNGIQTVYALSPATEAGLPDLFVRGATGALESVTFRPTNIALEWQRALNVTLNVYGSLGRPKPPANPGGRPPDRASFYGGIGPTLKFADQITLRPGGAPLDLLAGDTLSGGTTPRLAGYAYGGLNYRGNGGNFDFYCNGSATVRGSVAASTLAFAPLCRINLTGSLSIHHFLQHEAWTRHLGLKLEVTNVTDAHQQVHDADGGVPYRYQPDLLDPIGRVVTLSLRKLF